MGVLSDLRFGTSFDRRTCAVCGPETLHHHGCCTHCDPQRTGRAKAVQVDVTPWKRASTSISLRVQIRARAAAGEARAKIARECGLSKSAVQHILATTN